MEAGTDFNLKDIERYLEELSKAKITPETKLMSLENYKKVQSGEYEVISTGRGSSQYILMKKGDVKNLKWD